MLRVSITIVPGGDETRERTIGILGIARRDPVADPCDYDVVLVEIGRDLGFRQDAAVVHAHKYSDGAFELVRRALEVLLLPETREGEEVRHDGIGG